MAIFVQTTRITMNPNVILTDTDLFGARRFPPDEYQLIYGILYYSQSLGLYRENLYDLAASLCDEYQDYPLLKELKIEQWLNTLDGIRKDVVQIQDEHKSGGLTTLFYIPFFPKGNRFTAQKLISGIELISGLFKSILKMNTTEKLGVYKSETFVYPIKDRVPLLIDLAEYFHNWYLEWESEWEKVERDEQKKAYYEELYDGNCPVDLYQDIWGAVLWELRDEPEAKDYLYQLDHTGYNIDSLCTAENEFLYKEYFLNRNTSPTKKEDSVQEVKEIENVKEMSAKRRSGILLYMLESFGVKDREQARRLIHFALFHGKKKFKVKTDSNDTVYSYLHNDKQLFKLTGDIKSVLKEYDVPIPEGLKQLDERVFK